MLDRFRIQITKPMSTPLGSQFKLLKEYLPKIDEEKEYMAKVPYGSAICSMIYAMVCIKPNIAHTMEIVRWIKD